MMFTGEYTAAQQQVHRRVGITPGYEYAFVLVPILVVPQHGDTVCRVLAIQARETGNQPGAQVLQADETYTHNCMPVLQLGPESRRKLFLYDVRVGTKINEDAPLDYSLDSR
jgi:hypothetical protein